MRKMKLVFKIFLTVCVLLFLLILYNISIVVIQGQAAVYQIDSNYLLIEADGIHPQRGFPGTIVKKENVNGKMIHKYVLDEPFAFASSYLITDSYIVGQTNTGLWYAIDRTTHKTWYPYTTRDELQKVIGIKFSVSDLLSEMSESQKVIHGRVKVIIVFYIIFFLGSLIIWLKEIRGKIGAGMLCRKAL